jgi:SAM-dependent methyltransferase
MSIALLAQRFLDLPTALDYTRELVESSNCQLALDIGCGSHSHLTVFRPGLETVGIDAFPGAIETARARGVHDHYILADVLTADLGELLAPFGGRKFDLVTLYDVIEHLPKSRGFELLERCEMLTSRYIVVETPNGFVEQGPEFSNPYQRHLSGWFPHDFEGLGYRVHGTTGTRYLRGYAAGPKYPFKGCITLDFMLARFLRADRNPTHAFNLIGIKDVTGVPARLGPESA